MSTCRTRHVGGVLVRNRRVVADGFNGNLPKHRHCDEGGCERCNDPNVQSGVGLERCVCLHCEQNIIGYCAQAGISSRNTTIYLPATPCLDCMKLLIVSGVREVVYNNPYNANTETMIKKIATDSGVIMRHYICECGEFNDWQ